MTLVNEIFEDVVHHCLEGSWAVGEAKEHDQGFKEASIRPEGSLPLVSLFDLYIVISPSYVQLCEVLGFGVRDPVDDIWDEGKWVGILHHHHIKLLVILAELWFPILLLDKEDRGCHQRF